MPRILKFCTNIGYDKLYCVLKNQPQMAYQSLYLSVFVSASRKTCQKAQPLVEENVL